MREGGVFEPVECSRTPTYGRSFFGTKICLGSVLDSGPACYFEARGEKEKEIVRVTNRLDLRGEFCFFMGGEGGGGVQNEEPKRIKSLIYQRKLLESW